MGGPPKSSNRRQQGAPRVCRDWGALGNIIDLDGKFCLQMFIEVIKTDCCLFSKIDHITEFTLLELRRHLLELWLIPHWFKTWNLNLLWLV